MRLSVDDLSCEEIVVLDFETTGLSPQYDRTIEVAAVTIKNEKIVDTFSQLMNPGRGIPSFITSLTGITNGMIRGMPAPENVMPKLKQFIGNRLIVAHNASFDKKFLIAEMDRVDLSMENNVLCTMVLSRKLLPDVYNYKLSTLASHLKISANNAHRALGDVQVTAQLWNHLYAKVSERTGIKRPDAALLMAINKRPKSAIDRYLEKIQLNGFLHSGRSGDHKLM